MSQSKNKLIFTVLFFVTGLLIGSFFNSQSAHAFTVNNQNSISFTSTSYCDADWTLDEVFSFQYSPSLGSYGNSSSGTPQSFDIWTTHIRPNIKKHKYLIYSTKDGKVNVFVNYNHHDQYKIKVNKNGIAYLVDNKNSTIRYDHPKVFSASNHSKWQDYDLMFFTLYPSPKNKSCVDYPILKNIGLSAYFSNVADIRQDYEVFKSNFQVEYEDGYDGPRIPLGSNISTDSLSFQPVLSGQIKGQELSAVVEPDNMISDIDYFSAQKYQYKLFKFNNNNYDLIDTKVLKFGEVYKYNFNSESSNGLYKVEVLPILQVPYQPKYNFISSYIPLEYSGFSTNSYFSTKNVPFSSTSNFSFENCDALDVPCHIRNVITTISKAFYDFGNFLRNFLFKDVLGFIKFLFIPSFDDIKSYYLSFIDSIKLSLGGLYGFGESVSLSMTSFFKMIYPSFSSDYTPPCRFIPNFNVFGSPMSIDLCSFEKSIGTSNFNLIRGFVSISFVFSSLFISRGILFRFFSMLGDS